MVVDCIYAYELLKVTQNAQVFSPDWFIHVEVVQQYNAFKPVSFWWHNLNTYVIKWIWTAVHSKLRSCFFFLSFLYWLKIFIQVWFQEKKERIRTSFFVHWTCYHNQVDFWLFFCQQWNFDKMLNVPFVDPLMNTLFCYASVKWKFKKMFYFIKI